MVDGVGSFEITRVFFSPIVRGGLVDDYTSFDLGHGQNKLAGETIESVELDTHTGMTIRCTGGLRVLIPITRVQATYRV